MEQNLNNNKELMFLNYNVKSGDVLYFNNMSHTSNYKIILNDDNLNFIAVYANKKRQGIKTVIGGVINIYLNIDTYDVRIELVN